MKKLFTLLFVAVATCVWSSIQAQEDLQGSAYRLIYLDEESSNAIPAGQIATDLRVNNLNLYLYVWDGTYSVSDPVGKNYNNNFGGYLNLTVGSVGWSGLGFLAEEKDKGGNPASPVDLTGVTNDYTFHIAMKSTATNSHLFTLRGGSDALEGHLCFGTAAISDGKKNYQPFSNFTRDGQWHLIEIPMKEFFDAGLKYTGPFYGNYFTLLSGGTQGANFGMDAIYIYKKKGTGINNPGVANNQLQVISTKNVVEVLNATYPIEIYSVTGQLVYKTTEPLFGTDQLSKGIYVIKSGNATAKIVIK
jgi:hypothetical protein